MGLGFGINYWINLGVGVIGGAYIEGMGCFYKLFYKGIVYGGKYYYLGIGRIFLVCVIKGGIYCFGYCLIEICIFINDDGVFVVYFCNYLFEVFLFWLY